ncbi:hypothetical protein EDB89DRAFT_843570 [Lactarius sanguifluus]|nr:hypothetical protein EDB89DRAFT_843570 [Lactarius sanguifluus]
MDTQSDRLVSLPSFAGPLLSIDSPSIRPTTLPGDPSSGEASHINETAQGRHDKGKKLLRSQDESDRPATTASVLPDDVLLEIFDFYRKNHNSVLQLVWKWHIPAHVCQRWRQVVFASPHRLNLKILCTYGTPVRKNLGIWPPFPIVMDYRYSRRHLTLDDEDDAIAALGHPDRICYVGLDITNPQLGKITTVMQQPFPMLTHLHVVSKDGNAPVLPGEFLEGPAPCLQEIEFQGIPFLTLPSLLLSTSDLVKLRLFNIPPTGYISPEVMVACLAGLPSLQTFIIGFQLATRPDRLHPPPITRTVLPALTSFEFKGANEYVEDLASRIDGPQLGRLYIHYLNQIVDLQVAQLSKFIDRSVGPEITQYKHAQVGFISGWATFTMYRSANHPSSDHRHSATTVISCKGIDWQVFHVAQMLSHFSAILSNVVHLDLEAQLEEDHPEGRDDVEWLHFLRQFSTVKVLRVSHEIAKHVALALEDITAETVAGALPSLDSIYLEGQPASSVEKNGVR